MEMKTLYKFKITSKKIIYLLFFICILSLFTNPVSAKFYQSGLVDYIQANHQISVPIFSPAEKIELSTEADAVLTAAGAEDFDLEKGEKYYITQGDISIEDTNLSSGWGIQIMASSSAENAADFKAQAELEFDNQIVIQEEAGLFKVIAGAFSERSQAENFQGELKELGFNGWVREVNPTAENNQMEVNKTVDNNQVGEGLNFFNAEGKKIREAHVFKIKGEFKAAAHQMQGDFQFGPLGNSVLFSYKTNLDELTSYLLQSFFNSGAPLEALKAQAVLYRTSLLYQLETRGARLNNFNNLSFGALDPIFKKAAAETSEEVLIRGEEFYYNTDFSLRELKKPRAGIIPLAQAEYKYDEIVNYYYDRSSIAKLSDLLDSEVKFTARINRGLKFKEIRQMSWSGPRVITVVDYDLKVDQLKLRPVLAQGVVPGREDLEDLIKKNSALAGVNGGYFHYSGRPLGLLYINGALISEPLYNRTSLLIDKDDNISFAQVEWQGELEVESYSKKVLLDGVNRSPSQSEAVLFNSYYGVQMPTLEENFYDIVIRSNEILGVENKSGTRTPIPPDGFIIRTGRDKANLRNLIPEMQGKTVSLVNNFSPNLENENIIHAVGGGPRLLKDGEIKITGGEERFQNDILYGRAPRTALGLTADNHLLMLTIDGRQSNLSVGMTLEELAHILKELGAVEAMNLDGGGSARMVIRGFTMSNPSEKRLISNGVVVNKKD